MFLPKIYKKNKMKNMKNLENLLCTEIKSVTFKDVLT